MYLAFLKTWWKEIAVAALAATVYLYWHHLTSQITSLENNIISLQTVNTVLKSNNDKLELAIKTNNSAVQALSDGATKTKSDFNDLNANVTAQIAALNPKLTAILKGVKPVSCEATVKYLLDARTEYPR